MSKLLIKLFTAVLIIVVTVDIVHSQPKNVVFILADDHRYDYMGFHPNSPEFLETPAMDRMAAESAHLENAFVSTSLCSPSRALILTGNFRFGTALWSIII